MAESLILMKRKPSQAEMEKIMQAVAVGDRIEATNLYMSITECGLTEAQKTIAEFTTDFHASKHEKFVTKQKNKWWRTLFKDSE